ncbi:MAG TPA: VanZ family protein [Gemmatimonadaceae bacterium]|nr:VanZ family protein [Gemmatimonadaceae bacterium]
MTARRVGLGIAVVAAIVIAVATLMPRVPAAHPGNYDPRCRICGPMTGVDLVGNVLLFMPLGAGLAIAGFTRRRAVQAGALASVAIELLQLAVIPGRDPSLVDVLANTLGTLGGVLIGAHWRTLVSPSRQASTVLAAASGAAYIAMIAAVSWALGPGLPEGPWYLERGIGTRLKPSGQVLDARASSEPMVGDTMTNVPTVRRDLLAGKPVTVTAAIAPGPSQATSFIQILDTSLDNIVTIDRRGDDAAFFSRLRGGSLRLQRIGVRLPGFFATSVGDTVTLSGARVGPRLEIAGERNGRASSITLLLTPGVGWALFVSFRGGLVTGTMLSDIAWTILLLLPFAYWSGRAARLTSPLRWHLTRLGVACAGIGLVPLVFRIGPSHWWEWLGAMVALLAGHLAATAGASSD